MEAIKAIETRYKGYRFRSRLEARWAVFMETLGWRWEYENEGYRVGQRNYLPDFKIIVPGPFHLEVKATCEEIDEPLLKEFSNSVGRIFCACGTPEVLHEQVWLFEKGEVYPGLFTQCRRCSGDCFMNDDLVTTLGNCTCPPDRWKGTMSQKHSDKYARAFEASRSARFEHGESP